MIYYFILFPFRTFSNDSIPSKTLKEVTVVAERGWVENGIINVIPTKKEKQLSNSPASLVDAMNLSFIREKEGQIVNAAGETVQIFINGEKANKIDLNTFWPKEVKRLQYLENPSDPQYMGEKLVINFIVDKYEYGGVSRADLYERVPNNGRIAASSKMVYKKMTYGAMVDGKYYRDHRTSMNQETTYRDFYYNGKKYDELTRNEDQHSYSRYQDLGLTFNAKYSSDRLKMTHTFSTGWYCNPGSGSNSSDVWSENLFGTSTSSTYNKNHNFSPQVSGAYKVTFSNKWYLSATWRYSYARNNTSTWNKLGDTESIYNNTAEDVNSVNFSIIPTYKMSAKWYFQFIFNGNYDSFSSLYSGSANLRQKQSREDITSYFKVYWIPKTSVTLTLDAGTYASLWQIEKINKHTLNPVINTSLHWTLNRKWNIIGTLRYTYVTPDVSYSNPVFVKSSELIWLVGNPFLKNKSYLDFAFYSTYIPRNWLSITGLLMYDRINDIYSTYISAPEEMGGLVREYQNGSPIDKLILDINSQIKVPGTKLSLGIRPAWISYRINGHYPNKLSYASIDGNISYNVGNIFLKVWYEDRFKRITSSGLEKTGTTGTLNATVAYGKGNIYILFRIDDILNNKNRWWGEYNSVHYSTHYNKFITGRKFSLTLTYTIGYGKKIDQNIDISGPEQSKTSVINAN